MLKMIKSNPQSETCTVVFKCMINTFAMHWLWKYQAHDKLLNIYVVPDPAS